MEVILECIVTGDGIIVKANDEGINNDTNPAVIEVINETTGETLCKLKAVIRPHQGADGQHYPFIEFEEMTFEPKKTTDEMISQIKRESANVSKKTKEFIEALQRAKELTRNNNQHFGDTQ